MQRGGDDVKKTKVVDHSWRLIKKRKKKKKKGRGLDSEGDDDGDGLARRALITLPVLFAALHANQDLDVGCTAAILLSSSVSALALDPGHYLKLWVLHETLHALSGGGK